MVEADTLYFGWASPDHLPFGNKPIIHGWGEWKRNKKKPQNIYGKVCNATHILWIIYVLLKVLCTSNPMDIFHFFISVSDRVDRAV